MSNKLTDNNGKQTQELTLQQQSDEAFINELYEEVSKEDQSQPSEILDHRIISAAHKAIHESNKTKSKSHFKWHSTFATAASLTLVISLVVLQQSNIIPSKQAGIMPQEEVTLKDSIKTTTDKASFSDQAVIAEQVGFQAQANYPAISRQMANANANNTKVATDARSVRTMKYAKNTQQAKQESVKKAMSLSPLNTLRFENTEKNKAQVDKAEIIDLSIKELKQYIYSNKALNEKNQWLWSFYSENDIEYIIAIFQNNQQPLQYRLDKNTFRIIGISEKNLATPPLTNQALSKIAILNTNN